MHRGVPELVMLLQVLREMSVLGVCALVMSGAPIAMCRQARGKAEVQSQASGFPESFKT